jgi:competence protein ComEC
MPASLSASKILFYFCLSFIAGVFLESVISAQGGPASGGKVPQIFLWAFLFADFLAVIIFLFIKKGGLTVFSFCFLFLLIGVLRLQISEFNIGSNELRKLNDGEKVVLTGVISNEPDIRDTYQKLEVEICALGKGTSTVLVTTNRYPEYKYLDKIKITGKLETPKVLEDFSYKNYLMKDGIYSVMYFPKVELLPEKSKYTFFTYFYEKVLFLKQKLRESIRNSYSPPQSLILEGTVVGDNGVMSEDLKNKLNITGLRHVIAVSGTHIIILSAILMSFLLMIGLWRGQAFYFSIILIWLYIILTGLAASGIRAGIMGSLFLLAQKFGRQSLGSRTITMAGALMLLQNPLLLFYDVGFQLSFLAALGIIFLTPIFKALFDFFKKRLLPKNKENFQNLSSILSSTFSAQIFTLPVMLYNFGNISLIAPITNLLILPIVPLMMIFGFISSIFGMFSQVLGQVLAVPCWILLTYFLKVIDIFSQPWAIKTFKNVHWIWLVILYLIIILSIKYLNKKYSKNFV